MFQKFCVAFVVQFNAFSLYGLGKANVRCAPSLRISQVLPFESFLVLD